MGLKVRRDGEKGEMRYGSGGIGRLCTYYYAVTTRITLFMVGWALKTLVIYHSMSSSSP